MGQAKQRGTFEQRLATAKERDVQILQKLGIGIELPKEEVIKRRVAVVSEYGLHDLVQCIRRVRQQLFVSHHPHYF